MHGIFFFRPLSFSMKAASSACQVPHVRHCFPPIPVPHSISVAKLNVMAAPPPPPSAIHPYPCHVWVLRSIGSSRKTLLLVNIWRKGRRHWLLTIAPVVEQSCVPPGPRGNVVCNDEGLQNKSTAMTPFLYMQVWLLCAALKHRLHRPQHDESA